MSWVITDGLKLVKDTVIYYSPKPNGEASKSEKMAQARFSQEVSKLVEFTDTGLNPSLPEGLFSSAPKELKGRIVELLACDNWHDPNLQNLLLVNREWYYEIRKELVAHFAQQLLEEAGFDPDHLHGSIKKILLQDSYQRVKALKVLKGVTEKNLLSLLQCFPRLHQLHIIPSLSINNILQYCTYLRELQISTEKFQGNTLHEIANHCKELNHVCLNLSLSDINTKDITEFLNKYPKLVYFGLTHTAARVDIDEVLKALGSCPSLTQLTINNCDRIAERQLPIFGKTPGLTSLDLSGCNWITDDILVSVGQSFPQLKHLVLASCSRRKTLDAPKQNLDKGMESVLKCPLEELDLSKSPFFSKKIIKILASCGQKLKRINLSFCSAIEDEHVTFLATKCLQLNYFNLNHCKDITDRSLQSIAVNLRDLKELDISYCDKITSVGLFALAEHCQNLHTLNLENTHLDLNQDKDFTIANFLSKLIQLDITYTKISQRIIAHILRQGSPLRDLSIAGADMSDQNLELIAENCQQLRTLQIRSKSSLTVDGIKRLMHRCKLLELILPNTSLHEEEIKALKESFPWRFYALGKIKLKIPDR